MRDYPKWKNNWPLRGKRSRTSRYNSGLRIKNDTLVNIEEMDMEMDMEMDATWN
jgi:hypothetical protein